MKNSLKTTFLFVIILVLISCSNKTNKSNSVSQNSEKAITELHPQHSSKFIADATKKVQQLISENNYTSFNNLQSQKLDRIEENSEVLVDVSTPAKMNGNQMYSYLKERTLLVGGSYLCNHCPNIHLNNASGFVISEDGVIATNYHVIEVKENMDISGLFATDHEGNVYPITKILAASQSNDLAILQVNTGGKKLKALPLAEEELMGSDIYLMGNPFSNTFLMTKGIIGRKFISERDGEVKIAVTAEFGPGASGGPIVNENGQIVGMVSAIEMKFANGSPQGGVQMILKEAIPVSVLNKYVKRN